MEECDRGQCSESARRVELLDRCDDVAGSLLRRCARSACPPVDGVVAPAGTGLAEYRPDDVGLVACAGLSGDVSVVVVVIDGENWEVSDDLPEDGFGCL